MYWPVFQDVFANDIKNFEEKLASTEVSDEIRTKFIFDNNSKRIASKAMYFWIKTMSMESIAFSILSLTQQDFDDYFSDIQKGKIVINSLADLNLWEMVKNIVSKKSKDRVDKIFDRFKDSEVGDYKIQTFDFYAKESEKKFGECENGDIVWINLCATLKNKIETEVDDIKKQADSNAGITSDFRAPWFEAEASVRSLGDANGGYRFLQVECQKPSVYKKCVGELMLKYNEISEIQNQVTYQSRISEQEKIDMKKLIESSKERRELLFKYETDYYTSSVLGDMERKRFHYAPWAGQVAASSENKDSAYVTIMSILLATQPEKINSIICLT